MAEQLLFNMHLHSNFSDGEKSPEELVKEAKNLGLEGICLTDHETIDGEKEFFDATQKYQICGILGAELYGQLCGVNLHLLVYGLTSENWHYFEDLAKKNQHQHLLFGQKILQRYQQEELMNVDIFDVSKERVTKGPYVNFLDIIHYRARHYQLDIMEVRNDLWARFGQEDSNFRETARAFQIIQAAHEAKLPVIAAHLGWYEKKYGREFFEKITNCLLGLGISGFEVSHPSNSSAVQDYLKTICRQTNLLITGGSDYHGPVVKPTVKLNDNGTTRKNFQKLWNKIY